jgi:transcription initiation factor TFIID subunit 13
MLYGFGDDPNPHPDSLQLVQDLTLSYLSTFLHDCLSVSQQAGSAKVRLEDIMYVLRKDEKKRARVEELLFMNEELKKARRAFEVEEGANGGNANGINNED